MAYASLCTEFYDLTKPIAGIKELSFYEALLGEIKSSILEAMCGSGRLLIPLMNKGFHIDGVDNSESMLDSCRQRCDEIDLKVNLYCQSLEGLSLPEKYRRIFIAIGSFQIIQGHETAIKALKNLRSHLSDGGLLILETFSPVLSDKGVDDNPKQFSTESGVKSAEGFEIISKSLVTIDFVNQQETTNIKYEKWEKGNLVQVEEEVNMVRWYYPQEMQNLLMEAGFTSIEILHPSFEINKNATVYIAS